MHRKVFCATFPIRGGKNTLNQIVSELSRRFRAGDYPKNRNNLSRSSFFRILKLIAYSLKRGSIFCKPVFWFRATLLLRSCWSPAGLKFSVCRIHNQSPIKRGREKPCLKLKNRMTCIQLQIWSGFFAYAWRLHDENIPKEAGGKFDRELVRADLADSAFGENTFVYGHIDENGKFVRKRPARKIAITDKCSEKQLLSVKFAWDFA